MKLVDLLELAGESKEIFVYEWCNDGNTPLLAHYDGKDSIPENLNNCEVKTFTDLNNLTIMVRVPKTPTLAERIDKVMHDYDIYAYQDNDVSAESVEHWIKDNPVGVIEDLLSIVEDYSEQIEALQIEALQIEAGCGYKKEEK